MFTSDFAKSEFCAEMKRELAKMFEWICEDAKKWNRLPAIAYPDDAMRSAENGGAVSILVNPETRGNRVFHERFGDAAHKFVDDLDGPHYIVLLEKYLKNSPASGETVFKVIDNFLDGHPDIGEESEMRQIRIPREGKRDRVVDIPASSWMRVINEYIWQADEKISDEYDKYRESFWASEGLPARLEMGFSAGASGSLNVWIGLIDASGEKSVEIISRDFPFPQSLAEFRACAREAMKEAFPNLVLPPLQEDAPVRKKKVDEKNQMKLPL